MRIQTCYWEYQLTRDEYVFFLVSEFINKYPSQGWPYLSYVITSVTVVQSTQESRKTRFFWRALGLKTGETRSKCLQGTLNHIQYPKVCEKTKMTCPVTVQMWTPLAKSLFQLCIGRFQNLVVFYDSASDCTKPMPGNFRFDRFVPHPWEIRQFVSHIAN